MWPVVYQTLLYSQANLGLVVSPPLTKHVTDMFDLPKFHHFWKMDNSHHLKRAKWRLSKIMLTKKLLVPCLTFGKNSINVTYRYYDLSEGHLPDCWVFITDQLWPTSYAVSINSLPGLSLFSYANWIVMDLPIHLPGMSRCVYLHYGMCLDLG